MSKGFYTIRDLAERWSLSYDTVGRMIRHGQINHYKIGHSVRISPEMLKDYEDKAVLKDIGNA